MLGVTGAVRPLLPPLSRAVRAAACGLRARRSLEAWPTQGDVETLIPATCASRAPSPFPSPFPSLAAFRDTQPLSPNAACCPLPARRPSSAARPSAWISSSTAPTPPRHAGSGASGVTPVQRPRWALPRCPSAPPPQGSTVPSQQTLPWRRGGFVAERSPCHSQSPAGDRGCLEGLAAGMPGVNLITCVHHCHSCRRGGRCAGFVQAKRVLFVLKPTLQMLIRGQAAKKLVSTGASVPSADPPNSLPTWLLSRLGCGGFL